MSTFVEWELTESDLADINPEKAKEILVDYYFQACKFSRPDDFLGLPTEEQSMFGTVLEEIKTLFEVSGGDYEKPNKKTLRIVTTAVLEKIKDMNIPHEVIDVHRKDLARMLDSL